MKEKILFSAIVLLLCSCNNKNSMESPLVTVIKLNSAESTADFEEARKYLDVDKVYSKKLKGSETPEEVWKEYVKFSYNLGQDNKFTNVFKYHNYEIKETQHQNKAEVVFESLNSKAKIKKIVYHLEAIEDMWIVVDIEYLK